MDNSAKEITSSHLGMELEQYLLAYRSAIMSPPDWFGPWRYEKGRANIEIISALGRDGIVNVDDLSVSTLRSILHHSYSPTGRRELGSPALISGCIRILKSIRDEIGESPFRFELGFLCFHVIAIGMGGCLIERGQELGFEVNSITFGSEIPKIYEVPVDTSQVIVELGSHVGGRQRDSHNCMLGWSPCPEHKQGSPVVSLGEAGALLDLLYMDRHLFLGVLRSTYLPGLSAITFILWRYVTYQRFLNGPNKAQYYFAALQEVLWRCFLVSTPHEQASFQHIYQWDKELWPKQSQKPKAEIHHSKLVIGTFIDRLSPVPMIGVSGNTPRSVLLSDLVNSFNYVASYFQPGCEDLIAGYFGVVIEHMWCIKSMPESDPQFNRAIGTSMLAAFCPYDPVARSPHQY
ncbi:unnamed protein product [Rhizoctonia solani]|uniref:Uncharacterized protein n=1 Tax=Rhizoctonia solani TaxID=456999 RepID=A0A8H3DNA0_9AGAM|nr:unnamed protein product [Rhizoctonia solani]